MEAELSSMKRRLILSFLFLIPLFYISMGHMMGAPLPAFLVGHENAISFAFTQLLLTLPILYINDKYYKNGFRSLLHGGPNMDSLIAVGSIAAVIYGVFAIYQIGYGLGHGDMARVEQYHMDLYFESAGMILALIPLGKFLETRSKGKTSQAISRLMDLAPKTATVLRDGAEAEIPVEEVRVGDRIVVRPGQSIPVDGVIVEGSSAVDESALTGESLPVDKGPGDKVAAASINRSGYFVFEASRVGEDTTLAQMIRLVEEASSSKAPISKLADKVAGVFVPTVMVIAAIAAGAWWFATGSATSALTAGVAVLVISCPCALGLATPVAIMVGTGKGAEQGILIKSAEALETLHLVDTVVLDKTGTLTQGRPVVTDILPGEDMDEEGLLILAACLEGPSEHPLAAAIVEESRRRGLPITSVGGFTAVHGRGVRAALGDRTCMGGNRAMMEEAGVELGSFPARAEELAAQGKTPLYFADEHRVLGLVAVAAYQRPGGSRLPAAGDRRHHAHRRQPAHRRRHRRTAGRLPGDGGGAPPGQGAQGEAAPGSGQEGGHGGGRHQRRPGAGPGRRGHRRGHRERRHRADEVGPAGRCRCGGTVQGHHPQHQAEPILGLFLQQPGHPPGRRPVLCPGVDGCHAQPHVRRCRYEPELGMRGDQRPASSVLQAQERPCLPCSLPQRHLPGPACP